MERTFFGTKCPIDFWDQPILQANAATFSNLCHSALERSRTTHADQLIGHSFGCSLIDMMIGLDKFQSTVRISPIRDLYEAFMSLGARLIQDPALDLDQKQSLMRLISILTTAHADQKQHHFFSLVQSIFQNPQSQKQYWHNPVAFEKFRFAQAQPDQRPFSAEMWDLIISDYLSSHYQPPKASTKELVVFGENDPYYSNVNAEAAYWKSLGYQVQIVKNAGHYVHLETDILSDLIKF